MASAIRADELEERLAQVLHAQSEAAGRAENAAAVAAIVLITAGIVGMIVNATRPTVKTSR